MQHIRKIRMREEIASCFSIFQQLRPNVSDANEFIAQVLRQFENGYCLIAHCEKGFPLGLAGYRTVESFVHGKFIYIDDLIVSEKARSQGIGRKLLEHIFREASMLGFKKVVLDTALHNSLAQRFYFRQEMLATGLHFTISL